MLHTANIFSTLAGRDSTGFAKSRSNGITNIVVSCLISRKQTENIYVLLIDARYEQCKHSFEELNQYHEELLFIMRQRTFRNYIHLGILVIDLSMLLLQNFYRIQIFTIL